MIHTAGAPRGMVVAPHHLAAQAGLSVLRDGGNAIEAMVAAAATIAVVYPHMNGLGGDGFWLISEPGGAHVGIDACGRSAALASMDFYRARAEAAVPARGPLAANTVAGAVSGWALALEVSARRGGRMPLERLLSDAIWYARQGAPVTGSQARFTGRFLEELRAQPGFAGQFLDGDAPVAAGKMQRLPALAHALERMSKAGLDDFYRGELGAYLADELTRLGSPLRREDFERHHADVVEPLKLGLECGTVYNLPAPTQGLASLLILGIFERLKCAQAEGYEHVHGLVEATKQAFIVRNREIADPAVMTGSQTGYLSDESLDRMAREIDPRRAMPWPAPPAMGGTVWLGACDGDGVMVSYIQSVYWEFGSGVVLPEAGITWQNRGSSFVLDPKARLALAPRRKPFHTLNPACATLRDGRRMVYGTMGGDGQPQTQAAVFTRYAMFGQPLQRAISAPRWLLGRTWGEESVTLKLERRAGTELAEALAAAGHAVELVDDWGDIMGHAGAVTRDAQGAIIGAADPRSDGVAAGW